MSLPGIERCLRCDYLQEGLPDEHRCPECGLAYDEHSRVWRPSRPFPIAAAVVFFGVVLPVVIVALLNDATYAPFVKIGALLWFTLVLFGAMRMRAIHRNKYVVAVLPEGLFVRIGESELIPWSDVATPTITPAGDVRVHRVETTETTDLSGIFGDRSEQLSFILLVKEAREQHWRQREKRAQAAATAGE
jgi:hypothetical protein